MHIDPAITIFVATIFSILALSILMKFLKLPVITAYLLVGVLLGPEALGVIQDHVTLERLGSVGVVFLLFFAGMEVSPKRLLKNWKISLLGTTLQIAISVFVIFILGLMLGWAMPRIVLMGFVISLSSTAVVLNLLENKHELNTRVGRDVLGILLVQDMALVPMLISLRFMSGHLPSFETVMLQVIGGVGLISLTAWLAVQKKVNLPFLKWFGDDHEMQVFTALSLCFGMAMLTGFTGLSAALGAFVAGILVSSARETAWVKRSLLSIRTIFIAFFFISIGMLIDFQLVREYWGQLLLIVFAAFVTNTVINAGILKGLGERWRISFYGGSYLSQIGEFSFVIASVGYQLNIINTFAYEMTVASIAFSLLFSPFWIMMMKYFALPKIEQSSS